MSTLFATLFTVWLLAAGFALFEVLACRAESKRDAQIAPTVLRRGEILPPIAPPRGRR